MRYRIRTYFPLLLALLSAIAGPGCGGSTAKLQMSPTGRAMAEAGKLDLVRMKAIGNLPPLTDELIAEAWRENARRDSAKLAAVGKNFDTQIKHIESAAAALVETSHPLTVLGGPVVEAKAGAGKVGEVLGKVDKVLGELTMQGANLRDAGNDVGETLIQVQKLAREIQEIRQTQQQLQAAIPDALTQQAPTGVLGLITLVLAILLRRANKRNSTK